MIEQDGIEIVKTYEMLFMGNPPIGMKWWIQERSNIGEVVIGYRAVATGFWALGAPSPFLESGELNEDVLQRLRAGIEKPLADLAFHARGGIVGIN